MSEAQELVVLAASGFAALGLMVLALLRAWDGWLELKRLEFDRGASPSSRRPRSEVAGLRERIRRLEAIANGAEL